MKKLNKHLHEVTDKKNNRPILQGVEFNKETNRMNATDSHRLLSIKYNGFIENNKVINLDTLQELDGNYPNVERLFINDTNNYIIRSDEFNSERMKYLSNIKKEQLQIAFSNDFIHFYFKDMNIFSIMVTSTNQTKTEYYYFNAKYIKDLFSFIIDYNKHNKEVRNIMINVISPVRPIMFTDMDNWFKYLITPIRIVKD